MSFGWRNYDESLQEVEFAITEACSRGVIIVAAPGNHGYDSPAAWPACDARVLCTNSLDVGGRTLDGKSADGAVKQLLRVRRLSHLQLPRRRGRRP